MQAKSSRGWADNMMHRICLLLLFTLVAWPIAQSASQAKPLFIANVTIIDAAGNPPQHDEALQTATRNPAQFVNRLDTLGTIERGKIADLVLLDADPLQQIGNTRKISAVIVAGKLLAQAQRQELLAKIEAFAKQH